MMTSVSGKCSLDFRQQVGAGAAGHRDVERDKLHVVLLQAIPGRVGILGLRTAVTRLGQPARGDRPHVQLIVDDENGRGGLSAAAAQMGITASASKAPGLAARHERSPVQEFADGGEQDCRIDGLLHHAQAGCFGRFQLCQTGVVAGAIDDGGVRVDLRDLLARFAAAHLRHHHVQQHQRDCAGVVGKDFDRLLPVRGARTM